MHRIFFVVLVKNKQVDLKMYIENRKLEMINEKMHKSTAFSQGYIVVYNENADKLMQTRL